jgi:hypothetical protein
MCPVLARGRWLIGANPISVRARLGADYGALLRVQTAISRSCERPDWHRTLLIRRRVGIPALNVRFTDNTSVDAATI